ncbi:Lrp/AsnC family transcriptional regulator [Pseudonocardia alni]|jgi:DNA-binding Lrp family transcriptional regulator|uniref:AsnC family transcriptional regulator n=1 Tax=Pseudonocardia alni TaxID=33907 RepID=A0A852WDD9_PSEA5|nr:MULTISPECIES: Lrp/AsnC family transcriptional regulator [Pseudonocardia]MCO7194786.1 Lrp/AsnC family transcriptional regulator [Pseudonocardia sp. McavD-2-B]NYG03746.1 DNA-binding Lrp family transcriptional regulator [Pseudonocardia antarctica]OJG05305.1 Leucine-responsive regulatory protein [Pseudonocardia autotrophica]PKB30745.1 AsnC family transcriptional regulator [Pseudonocardia alni]
MNDESSEPRRIRPSPSNPVRLDGVDRALLRQLERDARTPNNSLAAGAGIAPSTCLGRIRALREHGVIRGYHADVDPAATGHPLQAMISVRLQSDARDRLAEFVTRVSRRPEVRDVYFLAGDDDYMIRVATADTVALRDLVGTLNAWAEVAGTRTSLIFEHHRAPDTY